MLNRALDRIGKGGKTIEGKIVAILLTLSLSLMAWNPVNISMAFADDDADGTATEQVGQAGGDEATDETGDQVVEAGDPQSDGDEDATVEEGTDTVAKDGEGTSDVNVAVKAVDDGADEAIDDGEHAVSEAPESEKSVQTRTLTAPAVNGVTVTAIVPEGALPEGTEMVVTAVESDTVAKAIESAVTGENKEITAVNISFKDANGVVKPADKISVTLASDVIAAAAADETRDIVLVHIPDGEGASANLIDATPAEGTMTFATNDFSTFALVTKDAAPQMRASEDAWTLTFYDRDAKFKTSVDVTKGEAIGNQLPETIAREDYYAFWAVGEIVQGGQGPEISVIGPRVGADYVPTDDTTIVPDYDKIVYTITFYTDESKTEVVTTKDVDAGTSYCLNDIPAVPTKAGYAGKWVYSQGDFSNTVSLKNSGNIDVWAEYEQNEFSVTFKLNPDDTSAYQTYTYYSGDTLATLADPVVEGKQFVAWYIGDQKLVKTSDNIFTYENGNPVTVNSDLNIVASFTDMYAVKFVVENGDQTEILHQYFRTTGNTIGTMPQDPFVAGKVFEKWVVATVDPDTGELTPTTTEVIADTVVNDNITALAVFSAIDIYDITVEYYYINDRNQEVVFNTDLLQVEGHELDPKYTITAPATTQTDPDEVSGAPIYYPETPTVDVTAADFEEGSHECLVRIQYVPYTAVYDFVYMLKDLNGTTYSEIEGSREENVEGVLNSYVTPTVKTFDYAVLERAEGATITTSGLDGQPKQELTVKYNRKNYQLSYETNGGSYVAGVTVPYGTQQAVTSVTPTRTGYTFDGWYLDEGLTQAAGSTVTINEDRTLYAKWKGETVNYTIVYMFEKYNDAGTQSSFVYDNSETGRGTVGDTVHATDSSIPDKTKTGWEKDDAQNATSSVTIAADGSSVLYVYYKLREYTFQFNAGEYAYYYTNYNVEATLTGKGVTGTGLLNYTMKVKLGQDISSTWPGNVTGRYYRSYRWRNVSFNGWLNAQESTRYVTKRTIVTPEMLPNNGTTITYTAQWTDDADTYTVNYWLQNADDDEYTLSEEYSQTYTSSSGNLGAKEIAGYTYDHGNAGTAGPNYNFYYNRDTFKIDYYYGSTLVNTINNVKFDANINKSPYKDEPTKPAGVDSDYTWGGWYSDSGLNTLYTFSTMPAANVVLYAKWNAPSYTVSFVDSDGTTILADSQTIEKYKKASAPETAPTKDGFVFEGWYTSADGNTLYDWNNQITQDTTIYAHWSPKTITYTVHYVDEDNVPVADDKVVSNPNNTVGTEITEQAIAVAGYRPMTSSAKITLTGDDAANVITFVYVPKGEVTSYTVKYLLDESEYPMGWTGGEIAVAEPKTVQVSDPNTASRIEAAAAVDYDTLYEAVPALEGLQFFPDAVEKTCVLTATEEGNVFTFYYSSFKHAGITVYFKDMDGNEIADADKQTLKVGNNYTLARTPISGWELNKAVEGTSYSGTAAGEEYKITDAVAEDGGLTFTIYYQRKVTITAKSYSQTYDPNNALKMPTDLAGQVSVEGLREGVDTLQSIGLAYTNDDPAGSEGRLNAGVTTVTPNNAVIAGHENPNYYAVRYISGTLEVTKINVTIRIEPDRWTGNVYDGTVKKTGFTNPSKGIADYVMISHAGYAAEYLDDVWDAVKSKAEYDSTAAGLGYVGIAKKDAGGYTYFENAITVADLPDDSNYSVSLYIRPGILEIAKRPATITTGSAEKNYDGTPLTNEEASISGLVDGETATVTATGTRTPVGTSENTYSITWGSADQDNYTITEELGTLEVKAATLEVTVKDKTVGYNGQEQEGYAFPATITGNGEAVTTDAYTVEGLGDGDKLTITYTPAKGKDVVGSPYDNGAFDEGTAEEPHFTIVNADGEDVTDNYESLTFTPGKLIVQPATMTIKIEGNTDTVTYDGAEHTVSGYKTPTSESTLFDASKVVGPTKSVTKTDASADKYMLGYAASDFTYNDPNFTDVTFEVTDGWLKIDPAILPPTPPVDPDARFTVEGPDDTVYNGEPQKQPITITDKETGKELKEGTDCVITYSDDTTNVGTVTVTITAVEGGNYSGVMTTTYQITPAPLTITVDDKTKKLGEDDPEFTCKIEGLQGSDTEESLGIKYSREEGEDAGEYAITATYLDDPNYEITVNDGKLTIEPVEYKITFDPNGGIVRGSTEPYVMTVEVDKIGGVDITIIEAAERTGYTFLYWRGSEYQPGDTYTVTEDHAFTAEWEKNAEKPVLPKTGDDRGTTAGLLGGMSLLSLFALVIARRRMRDDEEVVA